MTSLTKQQLIAYLVGIFLAGGVAGGFVGYNMHWRRNFGPPDQKQILQRAMERFQNGLNLTAEQAPQVETMLSNSIARVFGIHKETRGRIEEEMDRCDGEIEAVLTPEQKTKLEEMRRERREKGHRGGPRH